MLNLAPMQTKRPSPDHDVLIARQPIYNKSMGVFGYELLFRSAEGGTKGLKPTQATAQVLSSAILDFGLDELVLNRKAAINVTRAYLDVISDIQLPSKQTILDLPDGMSIDENLLARLKDLRSAGYGISVGGLKSLKEPRLLTLATIFRVDVNKVKASKLDALVRFLRRYNNLSLQALKIETMQEFRFYCDQGFDYLQGYFLSRPREYISRDLPANKLAIFQLLATVHDFNAPIEKLEQQISHDVSLSYKLLRLVNSPFFGGCQDVGSVKQAIVRLGRSEIRKWVSLVSLSAMSDEPIATVEVAILRAKLCELLAEKANLPMDKYFTVGMFSALDLLMRQPIKSILDKLPLDEDVNTAILERRGILGNALTCALAIENAQWSKIDFVNLGPEVLSEIYRQAIRWTNEVIEHV